MVMREKIADYLLGISKLVFAGVVLSTILKVDGISKLAVLGMGVSATLILAIIGFTLIRSK